jgi:UDP-glucose 4-epimerase
LKILVTGGAGFIASHIVDAYLSLGGEVVVVDDLSSGKKGNLNPQARFYKIDITSAALEKVFAKERPQIVNHHAAQIDVRRSVADPAFDVRVNILGTLNILNLCVKYKVRKIIFASTGGALYGEIESGAADERYRMQPLSAYAIDKRAAELYLGAYFANYGLKYTVLRYANVYGPRQDPHGEAGVVAIFCGKLLKGERPFIYGNGNQLRDYVYVEDVVRANLLALNKGANGIYNIGTAYGGSVNELFKILKTMAGFNQKAVYKPPRRGELQRSVLSAKKAAKELGWVPQVAIKAGLKKTFAWFSRYGLKTAGGL